MLPPRVLLMADESPARVALLLRGINVGKHNRVAMADLRRVLVSLGCEDVVTYLQSGNAAVTAVPEALAERTEQALRDELALDVRVLQRTGPQLAAVVAANPFPEREATPKQLHVAFLDAPLDQASLDAVGTRHGDDELALAAGELYLSFAGSSYDSPLVQVLPKLGVVMSARNWTTVLKLAELTAG
jgi:uncharacterized protein (DUF1697 family)